MFHLRRNAPTPVTLHLDIPSGQDLDYFVIQPGSLGAVAEFKGFSLTINAKNETEANRVFGALSEGGQVHMALGKTFFSPCFGTLADKFGVGWMVIVPQPM